MKKKAFLAPLAVSVSAVFASAGASASTLVQPSERSSVQPLSLKPDTSFVLAPAKPTLEKMAMHYSHVSHRSHVSHSSHYSSSY